MRFGAKGVRASVLRHAHAYVAVAAAVGLGLTTSAVADILQFRPILTLEQIFTDNVRASSEDEDADGITVVSARLETQLRTSRINAFADASVFYDEFWGTDDLDNFNGVGVAAGRVEILTGLFFVDAIAQKQDIYLEPGDVSASGLTTGQGTLQQTSYGVSPFVTTEVLGLADLLVRGNYARVEFDEPVVGVAATLLNDITIKNAGAKISTGERSTLYEATGSAEYMETDLGFEQRNVIGSLFLHATPGISAIGRIGYERITDPNFTAIRGTIWSLGGRYVFNADSLVQFEFGRRFGDDTYRGELNVGLTPRLRLDGSYTDTLVPVQLSLVRSVNDLLDEDDNFVISAPTNPFIPDPVLIDSIVRDKVVSLGLSHTTELRRIDLTLEHTERFYASIVDNERLYVFGLLVEEQLSRQLQYVFRLQYADNYDVLLARTPSQVYRSELAFVYQYNPDISFAGGYVWQLETADNDEETQQNVLRLAVSQAF